MIQHLVDHYWFDEIDLTHARTYRDQTILLDMQNAVNEDVKILCDKNKVKFE